MQLKDLQQALQHNEFGTQYRDGPLPNLSVFANVVHIQQVKWRSFGGVLHHNTVGKQSIRKTFVPVIPILFNAFGQHVDQCVVELLHKSITLWMVPRCIDFGGT